MIEKVFPVFFSRLTLGYVWKLFSQCTFPLVQWCNQCWKSEGQTSIVENWITYRWAQAANPNGRLHRWHKWNQLTEWSDTSPLQTIENGIIFSHEYFIKTPAGPMQTNDRRGGTASKPRSVHWRMHTEDRVPYCVYCLCFFFYASFAHTKPSSIETFVFRFSRESSVPTNVRASPTWASELYFLRGRNKLRKPKKKETKKTLSLRLRILTFWVKQ